MIPHSQRTHIVQAVRYCYSILGVVLGWSIGPMCISFSVWTVAIARISLVFEHAILFRASLMSDEAGALIKQFNDILEPVLVSKPAYVFTLSQFSDAFLRLDYMRCVALWWHLFGLWLSISCDTRYALLIERNAQRVLFFIPSCTSISELIPDDNHCSLTAIEWLS